MAPGLVPNGSNITIRQLLNHTSGLADFERDPVVLEPYLNGDFGHYWSPLDLARIAVAHDPMFAPGTGEQYCSTNYILAGLIVEAVTGHSLGREISGRIIRPLHLRGTSFPTVPRIDGPHAHGYLVLGSPPATDVTGLSPFPWAAGAIVSTAADSATFYRALLSGRLLGPRLLRAMKTTHAQREGDIPGQRYGLGLISYPLSCGIAWGHSGVFPGYFVYAISSADGRRQVSLEVNSDTSSLSKDAGARFFRLLDRAYCSR